MPLPEYQRSRESRVMQDQAVKADKFFGLPAGAVPAFPSYVPDAIKGSALFYADGTDADYPAGIYSYKDGSWKQLSSLPAGGGEGQILAKVDTGDFNAEWIDLPEPLPTGGTEGQVLAKIDATDYNAEWIDPPQAVTLPDGLVTGGAASVGGNILTIQAATWRINGEEYNSIAAQNFNLTAADEIHSRYDLIYGAADGLHLLDGIASANPVKPTLPDDTVEVAFAFVQPGSISAGGVIPADFATKQYVQGITGDRAYLATDTKNNLVEALNEVNTKIGAINQENVILKIFKKSNYR